MWALGCILHILLCGKVPFSNFNSAVQDRKVLAGEWDTDSQVSAKQRGLKTWYLLAIHSCLWQACMPTGSGNGHCTAGVSCLADQSAS